MKITARIGDRLHDVEIERQNGSYVVELDGETLQVDAHKLEGDFYSLLTGGRSYEISVEATADAYFVRHGASTAKVELFDAGRQGREALAGGGGPERVVAQMPGKVARILVADGDRVEAGQGLLVLEAMKMENEIASDRGGVVTEVAVEEGQTVDGGALLVVVDPG